MKYRFKFLQDAQEERAPLEPGKGGFRIVPIPAGTERTGSAASVAYWETRGVKIEVLEKIADEAKPAAPRGAFGVPLEPGPQISPMAKRKLSSVLEQAETALKAGDVAGAGAHLIGLQKAEIDEPLEDLDDDNRTVLFAAIDDLQERGELSVNPAELLEAIDCARDALLPPSRRRRK